MLAETMIAALAAPIGLAIGSFLNVVAYRLPRGESLVRPRSRCPSCSTEVRPYDNVPVVSWLVLRGRCRDCGARISPRYPAVELATAAAFTAVALTRGFNSGLLYELPFVAMLIAVAHIDLEHHVIPNKILAPASVWALVASAIVRPEELPTLLAAGAAAFAFFLVAALAYPAGMGMGDVKLAGVMGLYLGTSVVPALFVALVAGSVVGVGLLVTQGSAGRRTGVPFGPFLALGGIVGVLAGSQMMHAYTHAFLR